MTNAKRQKEYTQRRQAAGDQCVRVWMTPETQRMLKALCQHADTTQELAIGLAINQSYDRMTAGQST